MTPELTIPITVELSGSLSALLAAKGLAGFERGLAPQLATLVKDLGLSGDPAVKVESGNSNRALRVRVHGKLQPYDPELLKKVWILVAPPASRNAIESSSEKSGFNDGWLTTYFSNLITSKTEPSFEFEFLTRVVLEIISECPACLAGPAQVSAYITDAQLDGAADEQLSHAELTTLLKSLLDLGVRVNNYEVVRQAIRVGLQLRRSTADIVESIFTQLRSSSIEIHVHPEYLKKVLRLQPAPVEEKPGALETLRKFFGNVLSSLTSQLAAKNSFPVYSEQVDESIQTLFRTVESGIFNSIGIQQLPELTWVPSTQIPDGFVSIKINDRLSPPVLGLQAGELLVRASSERLKALNIPHRPAPLLSTVYAIVNEIDINTISQHGFSPLDISHLVPLVLTGEITRRAGRLVGIEDIEYQLAQIRLSFPALVRTAIACYSLGDLTRVMRTLVAEGISIRNVRAILEGMLKFDTITVPSEYIPFDTRFELPESEPTERSKWRDLAAFVRTTLRHFIGANFGSSLTSIDVFTLDRDVQGRAELAMTADHRIDDDSWLSEAEQEALRDSAWTKFAQGRKPILTTPNARAPIHDLIAPEIPDVVVVSFSELSPTIKVYEQGEIALDLPRT